MTNFDSLLLPIEDFAALPSKGDSQQTNFAFIIIFLIGICALFYMVYALSKKKYSSIND